MCKPEVTWQERFASVCREVVNGQMVRLGDMLTDELVRRCCELYPNRERIRDEVVKPNMAEIDRKLGQENDPDYLSYAIIYVLGAAQGENES